MSGAPAWAFAQATPDVLAAAEAALTPAERAAFAGYTFEKRRRDWLLGRWVAKQAAGRALGIGPEQVAIARGPKGQPLVAGHDLPLSLTHGHGRAMAIVAPAPVGVDLEQDREVPGNGWRFFLSDAERAWLADQPLGPAGEIVFWAVKEAAFKVLAGEVEVMTHLHTTVGPGTAAVASAAGPLAASWVRAGGFCVAVAAAGTAAPACPADFLRAAAEALA